MTDFALSMRKEIKWHGRAENEAAHYCNDCDVEVWCLLFVKEQDKKLVVHCMECARKISPMLENFVVLSQWDVKELVSIYDNFQLGSIVSSDERRNGDLENLL